MRQGAPDSETFEVRSRFEGPQALVAFLIAGKGGPHPVPEIANLLIEVSADTAVASSLMSGRILGTTRKTAGEYADSFVRLDGRWLFSARIYTVFDMPD